MSVCACKPQASLEDVADHVRQLDTLAFCIYMLGLATFVLVLRLAHKAGVLDV